MIALDTSVVVAAFASWHEAHAVAAAQLAREPRLPAHVILETYAVLTRLPPPHRAPPDVVAAFLKQRFRRGPLGLPPSAHGALVERVSASGLTGGAIYDALIGATAKHAGATLITRDLRASRVYETIGVRYEYLEK